MNLFHRLCLALALVLTAGHAWAAKIEVQEPLGPQPTIRSPQGRESVLYESSNALLISANHYKYWRSLPYTEDELDAVALRLRSQGFRVTRVKDPSGDELGRAINDFKADYGSIKNSRFLVMFSGHGYTNKSTKSGFLVPIDAPDPAQHANDFTRVALSIRTLELVAEDIESRHALFIFDSCFSGSIFARRSGPVSLEERGTTNDERWRYFNGSSSRPVRQFIAAGDADQELPGKSVFVPLLLRALSGEAARTKDGYVTGKEVGFWLEQTVPSYNPRQTPRSDLIRDPDLDLGDMVFQPAADTAARSPAPVSPPARVAPEVAQGAKPAAPVASSTLGAPTRSDGASANAKVTYALDAFFDFDKSVLRPEDRAKIDDFLAKVAGLQLEVIIAVGHTDSREGTDAYTQALSVRRAEAVKAYLVAKNISPNRVYTEGKGRKQPVLDNKTAEGRAKNRRVEVEAVGTQ